MMGRWKKGREQEEVGGRETETEKLFEETMAKTFLNLGEKIYAFKFTKLLDHPITSV